MGRRLMLLGQKLIINNQQNSVRKGFVFFLTNFLLFTGILFIVEIALILLGVANVVLPWTQQALSLINRIVF